MSPLTCQLAFHTCARPGLCPHCKIAPRKTGRPAHVTAPATFAQTALRHSTAQAWPGPDCCLRTTESAEVSQTPGCNPLSDTRSNSHSPRWQFKAVSGEQPGGAGGAGVVPNGHCGRGASRVAPRQETRAGNPGPEQSLVIHTGSLPRHWLRDQWW